MSSENPLVTVAMVTYNSSKYVRQAIESVLSSSYEKFELIISDDSSNDNTWQIIKEFDDERIQSYKQQTNLGEYANRNFCIDHAKGDYFLFIDGDDLISEHGLKTYMHYASQYPKANLILQKGYFNDVVFPVLLGGNEILKFELSGKSFLASSFSSNFWRRDFLKKEGGLSSEYIAGDAEIRLKALKGEVLFISGWLTWPRETPDQASSKLQNGVGEIEFLKMLKLSSLSETIFPNEWKMMWVANIKTDISKLALRKILQFKFGLAYHLLKEADMTFFDFLQRIGKSKNFLQEWKYSPENPLTKNSCN